MTPQDLDSNAEGRVPPHHLDAEKAVLGAILVDGGLFETAAEFLTDPLDFYRYAHRSRSGRCASSPSTASRSIT
jgi:hypothetical protein